MEVTVPKSRRKQTMEPLRNQPTSRTLRAQTGNWKLRKHSEYAGKTENKLAYDMRVREALEIRRHGCGPGRGLNEDMGAYIRTDIWDPVLNSITWLCVYWSLWWWGGDQPFIGFLLLLVCQSWPLIWLLIPFPLLIPYLCPLLSPLLSSHWWWIE